MERFEKSSPQETKSFKLDDYLQDLQDSSDMVNKLIYDLEEIQKINQKLSEDQQEEMNFLLEKRKELIEEKAAVMQELNRQQQKMSYGVTLAAPKDIESADMIPTRGTPPRVKIKEELLEGKKKRHSHFGQFGSDDFKRGLTTEELQEIEKLREELALVREEIVSERDENRLQSLRDRQNELVDRKLKIFRQQFQTNPDEMVTVEKKIVT